MISVVILPGEGLCCASAIFIIAIYFIVVTGVHMRVVAHEICRAAKSRSPSGFPAYISRVHTGMMVFAGFAREIISISIPMDIAL